MDPHNPYQAPQPLPPEAWAPAPQPPYPYANARPRAKPLGLYAVMAIVAMALRLVCSMAIDLLGLTMKSVPDLVPFFQLIATLAVLVTTLSYAFAIVFFLLWVHAAASNLYALGRPGMTMSPGWCVGCFFIPFVNLVAPYRALAQIWDASDPGTALGSRQWQTTPLMLVWWLSLLVWRVLVQSASLMNKDDLVAICVVELIGNGIGVVAAVSIASIMRDVIASQKKLFES